MGLELSFQNNFYLEENSVFCLSRSENYDVKFQASGYRYSFQPIDLSRAESISSGSANYPAKCLFNKKSRRGLRHESAASLK